MNKLMIVVCALTLASVTSSHGSVVWSESFDSYSTAGVDLNGVATEVGTGTFQTSGGVAANGVGGVTLTASSTRAQLAVTSSAAATAGVFTFDLSYTGVTSDLFFLQLVDGSVRNTGSDPVPAFTFNADASNLGIDATAQMVSIFFNVTGSTLTYAAPDSSTSDLANNAFEIWVGSTLVESEQDTVSDAGVPIAGVDSFFVQTFNSQTGAIFNFDNMSMQVIPEPATLGLFGFAAAGLIGMRRFRK